MEDKRFFLIQSSGKPAQHWIVKFKDRTHADEVSKHLYYRHENWEAKARDLEFGNARPGDYVIQYCTGDVESSPSRIKNIYEVDGLEKIYSDINSALKKGVINKEQANTLRKKPHVIRLRPHISLKRGFELSTIRDWVSKGKLSDKMNNCGRLGFNICQVEQTDYDAIVEWDTTQTPEFPISIMGSLLEEEVRRYIADRQLSKSVGRCYQRYTLFSDDSGRTGELYDTRAVGQIDLLYKNAERGDFLVVELKRTEDTADYAIGQIARYMGWVKENLAKGKKVYGLLVVRSASEELRYAVKAVSNCRLTTYEMAFNFKSPR